MKPVTKQRTHVLYSTLAALALAAGGAVAQTYPDKPVKIISPFSAGGPADFYARYMGQRLEKPLGQPFVIENRVGGGGVIGTDAAAKSPPDGYTLLVMSNTQTVNESLREKKPYKLMTDLVPIAPLNYSDLLLVVHPSVPAKNLQELIALARATPGKLNYASTGPGTPYHMAGELFKSMAGLDIVHVPHKESSGARTAVMGGQVEMMFDAITAMSKLAEAGKVRAIASSGQTRSAVMPDVPTVSEAGVPGYDAVIWLGIMAPAGTPKPIVDRLNAEIQKVLAQPEVKADFAKQGAVPMQMSADDFGKFLAQDIEKWAKVVKASGAKVD
jgi:tripartite-type tricarboxylate transporter receptor subunit TctC